MTTNFNAGLDTSDVELSFAKEAVWGVVPAVAFQRVRLTGESLSESKTRARPAEIRSDGQASAAKTQQVSATGDINFAFSYGTYDAFLESALNSEFSTPLAIDSAANDIDAVADVAASGNPGFTSGTASKFDSIVAGQWIRTSGFTNAANNGVFRVIAVTGTAIQVAGGDSANIVDETPASGDQAIRGSMLRNGVLVTTLVLQKKFASNLFLYYPGSYVSGMSLQAQLGSFMQGAFNFLNKTELSSTSSQSTGAEVAAPNGSVIDTVAGFSSLEEDDTTFSSVITGLDFTLAKNNARQQFGLGSAEAQGMGRGTIQVDGTLTAYFKDFGLYQKYKNETSTLISYKVFDDANNGYVVTIPAATLMNPQIVAGGPDSDVITEFALEGNPATDAVYNGVTLQIDRIPAP